MSWLKDMLKLRDLKRILHKIRDAADDDGVIDDLEEYVEHRVIDIIISEITKNDMYKALIRYIIGEIKKVS